MEELKFLQIMLIKEQELMFVDTFGQRILVQILTFKII